MDIYESRKNYTYIKRKLNQESPSLLERGYQNFALMILGDNMR